MTPLAAVERQSENEVLDRIRRAVAGHLALPASEIDAGRPLALYGLDSLTSAAVVATLQDEFGCALPEWLLAEHPTLGALATHLARLDGGERSCERAELFDRLRADARLPDDINPDPAPGAEMKRVLLTGATGFLGAWVLRELLDSTRAHVTCLVRGANRTSDATRAVRINLEHHGLSSDLAGRVDAVGGDLGQARLGMATEDYLRVAHEMDTLIHVGAVVDWVQPYVSLSDVNVGGTLEMLRLSTIGRPKTLRFVSSQLVCLVPAGPTEVGEGDDLGAMADRLPLGYAQTKSVAEALVTSAAARGLRASIVRPSLIMGDARTGVSHRDDFIGALIKGCIEMRAAPDLDWSIDAVPVDHVARAIVRMPQAHVHGVDRLHLSNARPRHWRECVLWMNLYGYPCALVPYADWLARLDAESRPPTHALHRLRPFFLKRQADGLTTPELYEDGRRPRVLTSASRAREEAARLTCAPLSAALLDRYFDEYVRRGYLPAPAAGRARPRVRPETARVTIEARLQEIFAHESGIASASGLDVERMSSGSEYSILGELTSWQQGFRTGLFHYRISPRRTPSSGAGEPLDVVVKVKPADTTVIDVGQTVAALCGQALGAAYAGARDLVGLRDGHLRELALYERASSEARRYMPRCHGTWRDARAGEWGLVLERLTGMAVMDAADDRAAWTRERIEATIDGLAALHAAWAPDVAALTEEPWIGHVRTKDSARALQPLWRALAAHAAPFHRDWAGEKITAIHARLVDSVDAWCPGPAEAGPRVLIHNDCNPRNIALRHDGDRYRLCAYDWELATIGLPQRDLVEFLCFVLPRDADARMVTALSERHRAALSSALGLAIDATAWRAGLAAAMAELLVDRLGFYTMISRVRPQPFLPRVVRTWQRLFEVLGDR